MTARSQLTRAFAVRLDWCCRQQGITLHDLAREASQVLSRGIRPERLPTCGERPGWIPLTRVLAEILDVNPGWLVFGEGKAAAPPSRGEN